MEDQIMSLKKNNIPAYMLCQSTPKDETKLAMMVKDNHIIIFHL